MIPTHQPQLTGIVTESVDCGVRSTSMAIDWATRGGTRPPVKVLRVRMGLPPTALRTTNPVVWAQAIESYDTPKELGGGYERLTGRQVSGGGWNLVQDHLAAGKLAIVAVDYGVYRRSMQNKAGSQTFDGYHAIPFLGLKAGRTTSFDPLLDGRYRGCPDGPVLVPIEKVERAAKAIGVKELSRPAVYAYLIERGTKVGSGVDIPEPDELVTLASILADLRDLDGTPSEQDIATIIADLESLIGPYRGEADPGDNPDEGVAP